MHAEYPVGTDESQSEFDTQSMMSANALNDITASRRDPNVEQRKVCFIDKDLKLTKIEKDHLNNQQQEYDSHKQSMIFGGKSNLSMSRR